MRAGGKGRGRRDRGHPVAAGLFPGRSGWFPCRSLDRRGAVGRAQASALMAARVLE